jgi:hypothetical protein
LLMRTLVPMKPSLNWKNIFTWIEHVTGAQLPCH